MATRNGRGRRPQDHVPPRPPKRRAHREKRGKKLWALTAVCALLNTLISVLMRISDRKLALAAIRKDDQLSLLYFDGKRTEKK